VNAEQVVQLSRQTGYEAHLSDPRELAAPSGPAQVGEQSKSGLGPDEAQTSGGLQNRVEG